MSAITTDTALAACSYRRAVDSVKDLPGFDDEDAATVAGWESGEIPAAQAALALRRLGLKTSATILKDHRRGECICAVNA